MASINVSEADFMAVASAAKDAQQDGQTEQAQELDKIARKMNAALTGSEPTRRLAVYMSGKRSVIRWQDMPSTLEPTHDEG